MSDDTPRSGADPTELEELRARLAEAEDTLYAIRHGEVDALLVADSSGERVYTLRSADAPYRALVEQMQDGAATLTTSGHILYCNRGFADLVAEPLHHVIGASIDQFVDPADRVTLATLMSEGTGRLRTRLRSNSPASIDAHVSVSSVMLEGVEHRTLIVTDMSTLIKVQRESQSKDEFLAMLAHELRNPLGAIGGAVQLLALSKLVDPSSVRAREVIERQVHHMARLVDDLLDVARVMTGKIVLNPQTADLGECARASVATITSHQHSQARVEIATEQVWVRADVVRLDQIIGNLVSNALKFTPPDGRVTVTVTAEGREGVLIVSDEGHGIDEALLPRIFDLFVQADNSTDRAKGGLGIGLTLVRRLIELHGGTITASSGGKGRGSTFTARFPAAPPPAAKLAAKRSRGPRAHRRVLLVDDNVDAREMYSLVLEADGHDVYPAGDGDRALAMFRLLEPDVAIIDIGLPGMDGYELARQLRSEPAGRQLTLIALTGYGFPADRERSRIAGFDRHLVKPVAADQLRHELE